MKTPAEKADEWGVSRQIVVMWCNDGRVKGAKKIPITKYVWQLPDECDRPEPHGRGPQKAPKKGA
jgi:hypothetical protein